MTGRPTIVKVGGSLLGWDHLPGRLAAFLEGRRGDRFALVVGGGGAADWIRDLDRLHALGPERAHALALRALDLSAHFLASLVEGLRVVPRPEGFGRAWEEGAIPVLP